MAFVKAQRSKVWLKVALTGVSGSGKTYSALRLAHGLANGKPIAFIDTENGSASLYSDLHDFDVMDLTPPFAHTKYIQGINEAVEAGYEVVVIDSFSHAWKHILDQKALIDQRGGNQFTNWNRVKPWAEDLKATILQSQIHVIACMRSKTEYVQEQGQNGKASIKKAGLAPIQEPDVEYEFTTVFDLDLNHRAMASKDRTSLFDGRNEMLTEKTGKELLAWRESAKAEGPKFEKPAPAPAPDPEPEPAPEPDPEPEPEPAAEAKEEEVFDGEAERNRLDLLRAQNIVKDAAKKQSVRPAKLLKAHFGDDVNPENLTLEDWKAIAAVAYDIELPKVAA